MHHKQENELVVSKLRASIKFSVKVLGGRKYLCLKGSKHKVACPVLNEDFALFLGLLWGDSWVTSRRNSLRYGHWRIGLVEDDEIIISTYDSLVRKIFSVKPNVHPRVGKYEIYLNSRVIYEILTRTFGFPDGKKVGRLRMPEVVRGSEILIAAFLRGIFSTDGKFVVHKGYPRIGLDSATEEFLGDIELVLKRLGFKPRRSVWQRRRGNPLFSVFLNGIRQTRLFQNKIGFIGRKRQILEHFLHSVARDTARSRLKSN